MSLYSGNGKQHGDIEHDKDPSKVWAHTKSLLDKGVWQSMVKNTGFYGDATVDPKNKLQFAKEKHIIIYATGIWRHNVGAGKTKFDNLLDAIRGDQGTQTPEDFTYNGYRVEVRLLRGEEEAKWGGTCVAHYLSKSSEVKERIIIEGGWGSEQMVHVTNVSAMNKELVRQQDNAKYIKQDNEAKLRAIEMVPGRRGTMIRRTNTKYTILDRSKSIETLFDKGDIKVGSEVIRARKEIVDQKLIRDIGEVGKVSMGRHKKEGVCVEWSGKDCSRNKLTTAASRGFTKCLVIAYETPTRRRMAQREFSSRRDSPVMVRLLEQIIDAQDD